MPIASNMLQHPSDNTIINLQITNGIKNNPIRNRDANMTFDMLGRSRYGVEGKTLCHQPDAVISESFPVHTKILDY